MTRSVTVARARSDQKNGEALRAPGAGAGTFFGSRRVGSFVAFSSRKWSFFGILQHEEYIQVIT
jgi:hypothetical protein